MKMSFQMNQASHSYGTQAVDQGLQSYMRGVYNMMGLGLLVTGLTAYGVASVPALFEAIFATQLKWVAIFAPLVFLMFGLTPSRIASMPSEKTVFLFTLFNVLMGVSMAALFASYTGESITRVFFITAATFAGTSLYGYVSKRDLTSMGGFLFMGLFGIVIASIINIFMMSAMVHFVTSVIGIFVFTGLIAFETQNLKLMYREGGGEANNKTAVIGALGLYLNFINLFQILLSFIGDRR